MKVSALKGKVRRIWVEIPGENEGDQVERIWVDYRPGELTLDVGDQLKEAVASGFETDTIFVMMKTVLAGWDLEDDDGNQLSVSEQTIRTVPLTFLGRILNAIEDDSRPNPPRGATSEGSSPQTEEQEASPNGTSSSEQQTGSLVSHGSS